MAGIWVLLKLPVLIIFLLLHCSVPIFVLKLFPGVFRQSILPGMDEGVEKRRHVVPACTNQRQV